MEIDYFKIADLVLLLRDGKDYLQDAMWDFVCTENNEPDISVTVIQGGWEKDYPEEPLINDRLLWIYETKEEYIVRYRTCANIECYVNRKFTGESMIYLKQKSETSKKPEDLERNEMMRTIRDIFFFHMLKMGRIAVHSASFIYRDGVWLFSALSGTGKSTHVSLWHENGYPVEDFNGDLAICYVEEGMAIAASAPWCGTSEVYCNKKRKLGGILFLEQAEENSAIGISVSTCMVRLAARCLTPNWNRELMTLNLNVAEEIAPLIVSGVLKCNTAPDAAVEAKGFIDGHCSIGA